nr:capsular associated protein [Polyrhizophydium stewartii]
MLALWLAILQFGLPLDLSPRAVRQRADSDDVSSLLSFDTALAHAVASQRAPPADADAPQAAADHADARPGRRDAPRRQAFNASQLFGGSPHSAPFGNGALDAVLRAFERETHLILGNTAVPTAVLPTLVRELVRLVDFLGPDRVFVSVFENGSKDLTKPLLRALGSILKFADVPHAIELSDVVSDYKHRNRIELLAEYRNLALAPMFRQHQRYDRIIFMNDVFFCLDDVLELLYETENQESDMTCGFDFWKQPYWFYDTWVSRSLSGNVLREFFYQGTFVYDPEARSRYELGLPVQAYSCWNGMAVMNSAPFYDHNLRFRRSDAALGECAASECQLIAKDMWMLGYGRILMVPLVRVVYDLPLHGAVRAKKFELLELRNALLLRDRWQDKDGSAAAARRQLSQQLHLDACGGLPLQTGFRTRMTWLGWKHEPVWTAGRAAEAVDWVHPGPERVVCYGMEGVGNPDADWNHPVLEEVPYAPYHISRR